MLYLMSFIGTRFVHTSEGKFLVTRLVPCPKCLVTAIETESPDCSDHPCDQMDSPHRNVYEVSLNYFQVC